MTYEITNHEKKSLIRAIDQAESRMFKIESNEIGWNAGDLRHVLKYSETTNRLQYYQFRISANFMAEVSMHWVEADKAFQFLRNAAIRKKISF